MKQTILIIAAVAALAASGYLYYRNSKNSDPFPDRVHSMGACLTCKQEVSIDHGPTEAAPFPCSACGQKTAFKWMYCNDCHQRFVPAVEKSPEDGTPCLPQTPVCISCKCMDVTYIIPGITPPSTRTAPLPPLPVK